MTQFKNLAANSPERIALLTLRNDATTYLTTEILLHYTDHGIGHSDRMTTIVDDLIQPIQNGKTGLSTAELTVLYAACYLHDLGMHVEKLDSLSCVPRDWEALSSQTREKVIRDKHHIISAELIEMAAVKSGPCTSLHLKDLHPDQVACLCEAHNLWLDNLTGDERYRQLTKDVSGMRMDFLAALLRLADVLDESQARACIAKAKTLALDIESQKHWWRHYYTGHISFSQANRTIALEFRFPNGKDEEYAGIIPELQYPYVADELGRHTRVLTKNDCSWCLDKSLQTGPYSSMEQMPSEVQCSMLADLQRRREERQEQERIAALTDLREARPLIDREAKELDDKKVSLSSKEFVASALALYRKLWQAGGKRIAWMSFQRVYGDNKESLPDEFRLDCECQLSAWKRECGFAFTSAGELQQLQPKVDQLATNSPLRFRFYRELFLDFYDLGIYYTDAFAAAEKALRAASSDAEKLSIVADLAEMAFLLAEPTAAHQVLHDHADLYKDSSSPEAIRCRLLNWRLSAMRGEYTAVIAAINAFTKNLHGTTFNPTGMRCLLLKTELLRLCGDIPGATAVFRAELWEQIRLLPVEQSITVAGCYQDVALNANEQKPLIGFYELVDERMAAKVGFGEVGKALEGLDAAAADKHYDAMECLLIAARAKYQTDNWPSLCSAFRRLAAESVAIKSLHDASFYTVLARDQMLAKTVATSLENCTQPKMIVQSIETLLAFAHLPLHAKTACALLAAIADEIPDALISDVVRYLLKCTDVQTKGGFSTSEVAEAAWAALTAIAERLDAAVAQEVAKKILAADLPAQNAFMRRKLIPVLIHLLPKLEPTHIDSIAEATVSMLTNKKHDIDYTDALKLLAAIAPYAPPELKKRIAARVYPEGKCSGNGVLLQIASLLDIKPTIEELKGVVRWLLQRLTSEVLSLDLSAEVPKTNSCTFTRVVNGRRVVTHDMPVALLWGLARHIHSIGSDSRSPLLNALLANLQNPEDSITNKCSILHVLPTFLATCSDEERMKTIRIVAEIASAAPVAPTGVQAPEEANHPLQRFRMHTGSPNEVRGDAIRCLTSIAETHPELCPGGALQRILEAGLASNSEDVRRSSHMAAQTKVVLANQTLMQILIGSRDESPMAAAAALYVFANNTAIALSPFAELLCYSLRYAVRSSAKQLRQACAKLLSRLEQESLNQPVAQEVVQLVQTLQQDRSWTVRQLVNRGITASQKTPNGPKAAGNTLETPAAGELDTTETNATGGT